MEKKGLVLVAGLLALVALVSCCEENGFEMPPIVGENNGISFSSNIMSMNPGTKASGTMWDEGDPIGVYMFKAAEGTLVGIEENIKYTAFESGESVDFNPVGNGVFFPDNGTIVSFMAYYPYRADIMGDNDAGHIYKVDVVNQTNQSVIDLLHSLNIDEKYNKYSDYEKIPLKFTHMLSQIKINLIAGLGFDSFDDVDVSVSITGMNTTADFNLFNGSFTQLADEYEITPFKSEESSYEAIVLPSSGISGKAKIVITLKKEGGNTDAFYWTFNNNLGPSNSYTYNVTVNRTGLAVEGSINDWAIPDNDKDVSAK